MVARKGISSIDTHGVTGSFITGTADDRPARSDGTENRNKDRSHSCGEQSYGHERGTPPGHHPSSNHPPSSLSRHPVRQRVNAEIGRLTSLNQGGQSDAEFAPQSNAIAR